MSAGCARGLTEPGAAVRPALPPLTLQPLLPGALRLAEPHPSMPAGEEWAAAYRPEPILSSALQWRAPEPPLPAPGPVRPRREPPVVQKSCLVPDLGGGRP